MRESTTPTAMLSAAKPNAQRRTETLRSSDIAPKVASNRSTRSSETDAASHP
jgi:hypothetical protein